MNLYRVRYRLGDHDTERYIEAYSLPAAVDLWRDDVRRIGLFDTALKAVELVSQERILRMDHK